MNKINLRIIIFVIFSSLLLMRYWEYTNSREKLTEEIVNSLEIRYNIK